MQRSEHPQDVQVAFAMVAAKRKEAMGDRGDSANIEWG